MSYGLYRRFRCAVLNADYIPNSRCLLRKDAALTGVNMTEFQLLCFTSMLHLLGFCWMVKMPVETNLLRHSSLQLFLRAQVI